MSNKLELTWYGKDKEIKLEPRLLIENKDLSNCSDENCENMLIHGDNLLALKALENKFTGKVKCIYIDPPYNTGAAFENYDDNLEHSIWLKLMKARLEILRSLLCNDGSIWIQIDDEEQAYLKVLCDEIFGRNNFINMISVNMKNIAGASGGGEDKRLKKNCEYILIYAKDYQNLQRFKNVYVYQDLSKLIQEYIENDISWKYTSVLVDSGKKEYIGSFKDGDNNEIKVFRRKDVIIQSVKQLANLEHKTEKEIYYNYGTKIFRTTNSQSSIRTRVINFKKDNNILDDIISIEYVPKTGKFKGKIYEQIYKNDKCNLFVWLKDTSVVIDNVLYKKDLQGTYWNFVGETKNLTKEGNVRFPDGKKAERLIKRIVYMTTEKNDLILDSFLGSGTTAAVAHKMGRRWIGIEMGKQAYTHCKVRLDRVINGEDKNGISKDVNWQGGGGYKFYELAPTLIKEDTFGEPIINKEYNPEMLASAVALHEGFNYSPSKEIFWKQSIGNENSYLFVTTQYVTKSHIENIASGMQDNEYLIIACKSFEKDCNSEFKNIKIKKIPQMLLNKCEFNKDDYNLNIIHPPIYNYEEDGDYNE